MSLDLLLSAVFMLLWVKVAQFCANSDCLLVANVGAAGDARCTGRGNFLTNLLPHFQQKGFIRSANMLNLNLFLLEYAPYSEITLFWIYGLILMTLCEDRMKKMT